MKNSKNRSSCPISGMLDIFGDKWSLLIIRDIIFYHKNTYGEFLKSDEKIATNILASRLLNLEENGIVSKSEHPDSKAKVLYALTEKGIDLLPLLLEIQLWSAQYLNLPPEIKSLIEEARKDKEKFLKTKRAELKGQLSTQ